MTKSLVPSPLIQHASFATPGATSRARGLVLFAEVPAAQLPRLPPGLAYAPVPGFPKDTAVLTLDIFNNSEGHPNLEHPVSRALGSWLPGAGLFTSVMSAVFGEYPEVMMSVPVVDTRSGDAFQYVLGMDVDSGVGIALDQALDFGFQKKRADIEYSDGCDSFSVSSDRGHYSAEVVTSSKVKPREEHQRLWDTMSKDLLLLGRDLQGSRFDRSRIRRSQPVAVEVNSSPGALTGLAGRNILPGYWYDRDQTLSHPRPLAAALR